MILECVGGRGDRVRVVSGSCRGREGVEGHLSGVFTRGAARGRVTTD